VHRRVSWLWEIGFAALPAIARLAIGLYAHPEVDIWPHLVELLGGLESYVFSFLLYSATFLDFIGRPAFQLKKHSHALVFSRMFIGAFGSAFMLVLAGTSEPPTLGSVVLAIVMGIVAVLSCGRIRHLYKL
jgi:hypothetical protein